MGHYLVYSRTLAPQPAIVLARVDGSGAHTLAHGQDPVLSPDGRWVAFDVDTYRGRYDLFVVSTRGGKPHLLARTDSSPTWSPSSDRIVTFRGEALVSVDLHGHERVFDTSSGAGDWAFSPDARSLVISDNGLVVIRATGAGSTA
jgi:Tol biopolymer transport system component